MRHCRSKWPRKIDNVGDVILVIDPTTPPRQWKLGKIEAVDPELDGNVRVVDVKQGYKVCKRSIERISPL